MIKNIVLVVALILCIAEGAYILKTRHSTEERMAMQSSHVATSSGQPAQNKRPSFLTPGMKFSDSPLFSKAYKIAPGDLSDDAKQATMGWDVKQQSLANGSTQVNLIPHEAEDIQQEFVVKPGYSLYFIELNLADDTTQKDENRQDDMGVLVDQNGIVQ